MLTEEAQSGTPPAVTSYPAKGRSAQQTAAKRILVVEDDEVLARFLERLLRAEGFDPKSAHAGDQALTQITPELDAVILDLNLPGKDGIAVLQLIRQRNLDLPVLVLTARQRSESAVLALESGADDCLTKPFSYVELLARLRAILRRKTQAASTTDTPALVLHAATLSASRSGRRIDLTPREFHLLEYLMRSPGVPVTRALLLREIWGDGSGAASNVVDVYMKYVRDKIDLPHASKLIHTVRGVGYVYRQE